MRKNIGHSLSLVIFFIFLIGCQSMVHRTILVAPVVSMTHSSLPENYRIKKGRHFSTKFCIDDEPINDTGDIIGLADQAIHKAQKMTRSTHLLDVVITREQDCVLAEGNSGHALRIKAKNTQNSRDTASSQSSVPNLDTDEIEWTEELLPPDSDS